MLFMQSMKKRISGELEVSSSVRYADVPTRKRSGSVSTYPLMTRALCCLQPWDRAASAFVVRQMLELKHSWFWAAGYRQLLCDLSTWAQSHGCAAPTVCCRSVPPLLSPACCRSCQAVSQWRRPSRT